VGEHVLAAIDVNQVGVTFLTARRIDGDVPDRDRVAIHVERQRRAAELVQRMALRLRDVRRPGPGERMPDVGGERFDVRLEQRPGAEAVLARDGVECVGQPRSWILALQIGQPRPGLVLQMFEIGSSRQVAGHDSSCVARGPLPGTERSMWRPESVNERQAG
jgi:hypothetical protein